MMGENKERDGWEIDIITNGTKLGIRYSCIRVFEIKRRELFVNLLLVTFSTFVILLLGVFLYLILISIVGGCILYSVFFYLR